MVLQLVQKSQELGFKQNSLNENETAHAEEVILLTARTLQMGERWTSGKYQFHNLLGLFHIMWPINI